MVKINNSISMLDNGKIDADAWLLHTAQNSNIKNNDLIKKALVLSEKINKGLTTFYGQSCFEQGLEIADILLDLKLDDKAIAAAMLSTIPEITKQTKETITNDLDPEVLKILNAFIQLKAINVLSSPNQKRSQTQTDKLRKTFLAIASDIRAVLIKLAEVTATMRKIKDINISERNKIAKEAKDIYSQLANQLGIGQLKWELEDLSFRYLEPEKYKTIAQYLAEKRIDRQNRINETITTLQDALTKSKIKAEIAGRAKHIYSIYSKMQRKKIFYKDIYDASAVRVLVDNKDQCYEVLSIVHSLYDNIPEEFDDYIVNPKPNGYSSIHTAVVGPHNKNLEIQIRTHEMHEKSEHGVAAHWVYKESKKQEDKFQEKIKLLRQLFSLENTLQSDKQNIDDIFQDRVYVFTPGGDIVDLTRGATPLDFAYCIHTDLGHRCKGAKVNNKIVTLKHVLKTGDKIDVITSPTGKPSRDWLNKSLGFIKTAKARSKINHWIKNQDHEQFTEVGRINLTKELTKAQIREPDLKKVALHFNFKTEDALYRSVGQNTLKASQIIAVIKRMQTKDDDNIEDILKQDRYKVKPDGMAFIVSGVNDLLTRISKCCKPIPGDEIVGFITQGRGVSVHKSNCFNITNMSKQDKSRLVSVGWDKNPSGIFYADLQIVANKHDEIFKEIAAVLANLRVDLANISSHVYNTQSLLLIKLSVKVRDIDTLDKLITNLTKLSKINDVKRI